MKRVLPLLLLLVAIVLFPYGVDRVFYGTGLEREMGTAQKIFYFHVPMAWITMLFAVICGFAAGRQLRKRSLGGQALATACGEMVVLAGAGVLITGPIWGNATWGEPWTGDARQVSTALLWLIFVAYVLVQRFGPPNSDRLAAALAIFGAIDVPIIYYAVKVWRTTHPTTNVVPSLPSGMWNSLWICVGALLSLATVLVVIRTRQERIALELDQAWVDFDSHHKGAPA